MPDLAVGARNDDDGVTDGGAIWILLLNADGTVKSEQKISDTAGGFTGTLGPVDRFGVSIANLGDLDNDGVVDLAVGALNDDDGGSSISNRGAVWILRLNANGTVKASSKISDTTGGFATALDDQDHFGASVAGLGDVDGDGVEDLAVGANFDDDGINGAGAVYVLRLNTSGAVVAEQKISASAGGFTGSLDEFDGFGYSLAAPGDIDGDGVPDLAVGTLGDDDGGPGRGAAWVLFLEADGTVAAHQKISDTLGGLAAPLSNDDQFGTSVGALGDIDGNGAPDLLVGAGLDNDGSFNTGAVYVLRLIGAAPCFGDLDASDDVGFGDILAVIGAWGPCVGCPEDLDGSGDVGFGDILAIIGAWGPCP
ncbi:MAG: hypothetical protein GY715_12730 [Planctomycetes bacterium]|nr:hypothetical protein [Planctomycetota bacterium]